MIVSKFNLIAQTTPTENINILDWLNDKSYKSAIAKIRAEKDKDLRSLLKADLLPCICPSGTVSPTRSYANFKKHSGFIPFDIDKLSEQQLKPLKALICSLPFTYACQISASGLGLWGLFKISQPHLHKKHFAAMEKYFLKVAKCKLDTAPSNPASARFMSYDPDTYINENSQVFEYIFEEPKRIQKPYNKNLKGTSESVADDFNLNGNIENLLIEKGWAYIETVGTNNRYTRPGKESGISANYCTERKLLYIFSSAEEAGFKGKTKGMNPWEVFYTLECNYDQKEAARKLHLLGYGNKNPFIDEALEIQKLL